MAYGLTGCLLLATVPWAPGAEILGMPAWAAVSLGLTVLYAVAVAWALADRFADRDEASDSDGP